MERNIVYITYSKMLYGVFVTKGLCIYLDQNRVSGDTIITNASLGVKVGEGISRLHVREHFVVMHSELGVYTATRFARS